MNGFRVNGIGAIMLGVAVMFSLAGRADAASVSNKDKSAQTIVVTEGASRREMMVPPGETVDFCSSGCFVTFPNGDREALKGDESVTISGGKATLK